MLPAPFVKCFITLHSAAGHRVGPDSLPATRWNFPIVSHSALAELPGAVREGAIAILWDQEGIPVGTYERQFLGVFRVK